MAQKKGFGLDIGQHSVKLVELRKDRSGVHLQRAAVARTGVTSAMSREKRESAVSAALASVLKGVSVGQDPLAVATPGLSAFTRYVKLPRVTPSRLKQVIAYEAQQQVPFPLNEVIWDYQVLKEASATETNVVMVAIKREVLAAHLNSVRAHGIVPSFVEHRPLAVYNSVKFNEETGESGTAVIIDVGERTTDISIEREGELCWTRSARIGSMDVSEALKKSLDVTFEEAERIKEEEARIVFTEEEPGGRTRELWEIIKTPLGGVVSEIQRSVNYFQTQLGGTRADSIIITGGCTRMPGFDRWVSEAISGPEVSLLNPLKKIRCPRAFMEDPYAGSQLAVATGLALRSLDMGFSRINLLPESVISRQELRKKRAYLVLSGISMAIILGISYIFSMEDRNILRENMRIINAEMEEYRKFESAITEKRSRSRAVEERKSAVRDIVADASKWPDLLLEVSRVMSQDVVLSQLGFVRVAEAPREEFFERRRGMRDDPAPRGYQPAPAGSKVLEFRGRAGSFRAMENLVARMDSSPMFDKLNVVSADLTGRAESGEDYISFVIRAEANIGIP